MLLPRADIGRDILAEQFRDAGAEVDDVVAYRTTLAQSPVNPYDIGTIKVLKGADAAIYGIDAADGVIVITLKQPKAPNPF